MANTEDILMEAYNLGMLKNILTWRQEIEWKWR